MPKPPKAILGGPYTALVGQSITVDPTASRPSSGAVLISGTLNWGDGSALTTWIGPPLLQSHVYTADGSYSIRLTIRDSKNMTGTTTASMTVTPPTPLPPTPNPPAIPATPGGLSLIAGDTQITAQWNGSTGATGYRLKRSTVSGGPYTTIATPQTPGAMDTGLINGTPYFYVVSAFNSTGESANSSQVSATPQAVIVAPAAPTGLVATPHDGQVSLSWNGVAGAISYTLKRGLSSGSEVNLITGLTSPSYNDNAVVNGTKYYYVVVAVNSAGSSPNSAEVSATPIAVVGGTTIYVHAGQSLQQAIDAAGFGSTIIVDAGASFPNPPNGSLILRNKGLGTGTDADFITIITSNPSGLPPAGVRVIPGTHAAAMPKVVGSNAPPLITEARAHHYRLVGIEITSDGTVYMPDLVTFGGVNANNPGGYASLEENLATGHIILDRCFVHPPEVTAANLNPTGNYRSNGRGVHLTGVYYSVQDSWIGGFAGYFPLSVGQGDGVSIDSYGVYADSVLKNSQITNNYLEANFNNIFLGGADAPSTNNATLTNCTTTGATFSQVANLAIGDLVAVYYAVGFTTGSGKSGVHWATVKITGIAGNNVSWIPFGPSGVLNGPPDSPGAAAWNGDLLIDSVTITDNTLAKLPQWVTNGFGSQWKAFIELKAGNSLLIQHNRCSGSGYHGTVFGLTPRNQNGGAPWNTLKNLTIRDNRIVGPSGAFIIAGLEDNECTSTPGHHISVINNLVPQPTNDNYNYVLQLASGHDLLFQHNTIISDNVSNITTSGVALTSPSIVFKDNIVGGTQYGWSCFVAPGTFGTCFPGFTETKNLIFNNLGADTSWAPNSLVVADLAAVQFVDPANGNYALQASSLGHLAASDGTDIGVNMSLLP